MPNVKIKSIIFIFGIFGVGRKKLIIKREGDEKVKFNILKVEVN
jgi:hypothetical protein